MVNARPLFIVNPAAGGGRAGRAAPAIRAAMRADGIAAEIVFSAGPGDATALARRAAREGYGPVVGVGGDGTLQEIVDGLMREPHPPPLAIVPAGSGNDAARGLGLPLAPDEALRLVCRGAAGAIDVGRCGERAYLNVGGAGFDAAVAAAVNRRSGSPRLGRLIYPLAILAELTRHTNRELVISIDGRALRRRALLVAVGNGRSYAGGRMICPTASMTDGLLDVCIVGDVSRREVLSMLPGVATGRHVRHPKVECYRGRLVRIEGTPDARVHIDGESAGVLPVEFGVVPGALRVVGAGQRTGAPLAATRGLVRGQGDGW